MIVLDASVLIAYLDRDDDHHDRAEALLVREVDDDFAVNSVTLAEVLVAPAREARVDAVLAALDDLDIHELPLPPGSAVRLAALRAGTRLRMPDCCVLLAAEDAGARLGSFDDGLCRVAAARGIDVVNG